MTQNKIIRFVLKLDPRLHVGLDEFKTLRWLPVSKRVHRIILNDVFEVKSGTPPEYMENVLFLVFLCITIALDFGITAVSPFQKMEKIREEVICFDWLYLME